MEIKIKLLDPKAVIPTKGRPQDACFDLYSIEEVEVKARSQKIIKTGVSMEIPEGYYGQIESRSGLASKGYHSEGGVIDSNYRGDVGVIFYNDTDTDYKVNVGDRIAQIGIHKVEEVEFKLVEELSDNTERGDNGFGSSGTDKIVVYNHI